MTTYFIRKTGSNSNDGLTPSTAWLTIGKANSIMVAGDTVYIGAGDYSADDPIYPTHTTNGVWQYWIGDRDGSQTGDAGEVKIKGFYDNDMAKYFISIFSFHLSGYAQYYNSVYFGNTSSQHIKIDSCIVDHPIAFAGAGYFYLYNSVVCLPKLNEDIPLFIVPARGDIFILNNVIYGYYTSGGLSQPCAVEIDENPYTDGNIKFENNIVIKKPSLTKYLLYFWPATGEEADYTINNNDYVYEGNKLLGYKVGADPVTNYDTLADWNSATGQDANSIETDPNLDVDGYHLLLGSPCINAGMTTGIGYDIDGNTRPQGSAYDIGAHEYPSSIVTHQQIIISDSKVFRLPDMFSFAKVSQVVPSFSLKTRDESKTVMTDAKLRHDCDHVLLSGKFTLNTCPRCLGNGYYYDIKFDANGDIITVNEKEKLLQELVKIALTSKGNNPFHNEYGSTLSDSVGLLQEKDFQETKLKQSIIEAVLRLKYLQRDYVRQGYKLSLEELIDRIYEIEVYEIENNPTMLGFKVQIITVRGNTILLQGNVTL